MADREVTSNDGGVAPGDQIKIRVLLAGGCFVGGLGIFALVTGQLGRGATYVAIGLGAIVLGVKMAQSVTEGAEAAAYTAWYTAGLGLAVMGAGAAVTVPAREAETTSGQVVLFLAAGILLWMGVTCMIAAVVKTRKAAAK
jgi:hypothetical protein